MRFPLLRILKNGILVAVLLAAVGCGLAELGGVFLAAQPGGNRSADDLNVRTVSALRWQVPFGMAAWGFGLVALFETLLWLVRGTPLTTPAAPTPAPDATGQLFDELLKRSEAANGSPGSAPPPSPPDATAP